MKWLFMFIGVLPLRVNHALGALLGRLVWQFSQRHRQVTSDNLNQYASSRALDAGTHAGLLRRAMIEQGKSFTELAVAWTASLARLNRLVLRCPDWHHVDAAITANRSIIFVSPHLGCFDIAGLYIADRLPITALYRPPKQPWLEPIMQAGRARGGVTTAPANARGVRALLKTLKANGNIMILPDQVPAAESGGEGVWADFFSRPAYTMTLLPRLAATANAAVLFFFAERLPGGGGYQMHIVPLNEPYSTDKLIAANQTNTMIEKLIDMAPAQYLWGYNRYKQPAGAHPPPLSSSSPPSPPFPPAAATAASN